jgi:sugar phosphate isomerase/epimerase
VILPRQGQQFSVMIWTLNKLGTFDENLERVAQAGYHHVELVGEFKKWSEEDYRPHSRAHAGVEDHGGCNLWRRTRLR